MMFGTFHMNSKVCGLAKRYEKLKPLIQSFSSKPSLTANSPGNNAHNSGCSGFHPYLLDLILGPLPARAMDNRMLSCPEIILYW
jgi:hypothetical protein